LDGGYLRVGRPQKVVAEPGDKDAEIEVESSSTKEREIVLQVRLPRLLTGRLSIDF